MSKVEAMLPQLRFEIFGSEWEKTKLGQLVGIFRGLVYKPENVVRDGNADSIRVLRSSNIDEDVLVLREDDVFVQADAVNIENVKQGDILITAANGSSRLVGKHAVIKESLAKTVHGGFMLIARTDFPYFINAWMGAVEYQKMLQLAQGGNGAIGNLSKKILDNCEITLPKDIEEQTKIGELFQKLDRAIELQQQKVEQSERYKKAMLQKMFPQKGEKVPRVRFAGFSGDWESKKLKQLGVIVTGSTPTTNETDNYDDGGLMWITPSDITSLITTKSAKRLSVKGQKKARIVPPNTLLITCIASIGKNTLVLEKSSFNQQINALIPYEQYNAYFLLTHSYFWSEIMKNYAAAGMMQIVNKNDFSNLSFLFPEKEEQTAIGNFFQKLDQQIEQQAQKLATYQQLKKAMLQRMFV